VSTVVLRPAIFLDRDGTLIHDIGYIRDWRQVKLLSGVGEALRQIQQHGYLLVVISNQSGIGRGSITAGEAQRVHERTVGLLRDCGERLDGVYFCPHVADDHCACRKPAPGLLLQAVRELKIDIGRSVMIGDKASDFQAGKAAGCRKLLLGLGDLPDVSALADHSAGSWFEIADWVLRDED
jgi:histidinol-phosphate phosphatase family protein